MLLRHRGAKVLEELYDRNHARGRCFLYRSLFSVVLTEEAQMGHRHMEGYYLSSIKKCYKDTSENSFYLTSLPNEQVFVFLFRIQPGAL